MSDSSEINSSVYSAAPISNPPASSAPLGRASLVAACIVVAIVLVEQVVVQALPVILSENGMSAASIGLILVPFRLSIVLLSLAAVVLGAIAQRNPQQRVLGAAGAAVGVAFLATTVIGVISPVIATLFIALG